MKLIVYFAPECTAQMNMLTDIEASYMRDEISDKKSKGKAVECMQILASNHEMKR